MKKPFLLIAITLLWLIPERALSNTVTTLTSGQGGLDGLSVSADGDVFVSQPGGNVVFRIAGDQVTEFMAGLQFPLGSTFDSAGNFYVSSSTQILRRTPSGEVTTYADGLSLSAGLTIGPDGLLYGADYNLSRVFRVSANGEVTTLAQGDQINGPAGIDFDSAGNLFTANFNDGKIIQVGNDGEQTVISTPAPQIGYITIIGDDIYATVFDGDRVIKVTQSGTVTDVAGTGVRGSRDGPAEQALFLGANGITANPQGDRLYVSEFADGGGVREIALAESFEINQGIAGAWFDPRTDGSGLLIDVEPVSRFLFLAWFTYGEAGTQDEGQARWFTATGNFQDSMADLTLFESSGGRFDDSQPVETIAVGTVMLRFADCLSGEIDYAFDAGSSGAFSIQRAIPESEMLCEQLTGDS